MPLYETVMQEKPPVVFDIGSAYTKLGFAAEAYPRKIISSNVILAANGVTKSLFDYADATEFYNQIVDFLQMIFFKHLLVSPKERKIVIVENVFGQTVVRETLARALFRHFEVASVLFVPLHMIALSTLFVSTGVIVDIGYSETTIMPVFSGVQIMKGFRDQSFGGRRLHAEIKRQLINANIKEKLLSEKVLEDIKVRTCFVTSLERAQAYRKMEPPEAVPSIEYPIYGSDIITLPGVVRETTFEILFEDSNERDSLPHLIMQAILAAPMDARKELCENIFVIGGSAIIMGLMPRIKAELQHLLESDEEYQMNFAKCTTFKFHSTIGKQNFSAWLGGSLCGGTDLIQTRSLTKDQYVKYDRVPDWISLNDNRWTDS